TCLVLFFLCQAEDGIRFWSVTGFQPCALPISAREGIIWSGAIDLGSRRLTSRRLSGDPPSRRDLEQARAEVDELLAPLVPPLSQIGRASCRERVGVAGVGGGVKRSE